MGDRIAQLILEKIETPPVEEVQGLGNTVHGSGGFVSTGVSEKKDTGEKKETKGEKERTEEKKESMDKNETLKGSNRNSGRTRTEKKTKTEGSSRLSCERQIISVKQLKKLVKKKTPVFLAVV